MLILVALTSPRSLTKMRTNTFPSTVTLITGFLAVKPFANNNPTKTGTLEHMHKRQV